MFTFYYQNIADKNTFQLFCSARTNQNWSFYSPEKLKQKSLIFVFIISILKLLATPAILLALSDVIYHITNHIFSSKSHLF